jgi:hypothetical protein
MRIAKDVIIEIARWLALFTLVASIGFVPGLQPRRAAAQDQVSMSGEVVDLACYLSKGSKGTRHKACAQMCAKKGMPLGLLTESGDVYLLIEDHDNPSPYESVKELAGEQAQVAGKKFTKGGMQSILVSEAKAP